MRGGLGRGSPSPEILKIRACQSPEPVARSPLVSLMAIEMTEFLCPCSRNWGCPLRTSQNWTARSLEPDTTQLPSAEVATDST